MKNLLNKFIIILGSAIILYILALSFITNFNIGNIMVFVFGLFLVALPTVWKKLPDNKLIKIMKFLIYCGFIFIFSMIILIFILSNTNKTDFNEDAVIVLGCAIHGKTVSPTLKNRLDKCIEYANKNKDAVIVVTGGQGPQEDITEAQAMKEYLVLNGIDENKILMEDKSTSTNENFKFSKKILDSYFNRPYTSAFITNDFHSYRASRLAQLAGIEVKSFNAKTDLSSILPSYMREVLAVIQLWVFKK